MSVSLSLVSVPNLFFIFLTLSVLSSLFLLNPRVSLSYVSIHVNITALPPIVALVALFIPHRSVLVGPWRFDSLAWLLALFVLSIGLIVQRYSVHYLLGDRSYRKYFALLTFTTAADSLSWLSNDLRLLLICWGATLLGLTWLIRLKKEWPVARKAAALSGRLFLFGWLCLLLAIGWLTQATGHWHLSLALSQSSLALLASWEKFSIALLLIAAVLIPAAQWPFQRWLLNSVVVPTPISAVMHAGIVNAGGIILTRFAPLFDAGTQTILLVFSIISVLMGTGFMLVQVDYKRQLVGSTIAQMGFMLMQCALGAYWAAITHAVLHGLFKATLFLRAGSAVHHQETTPRGTKSLPGLWTVTGGGLGLLGGTCFWFISHGGSYTIISAVILGLSVFISWIQLVASGRARIGKIAGVSLFTGAAIVYGIVHATFYKLLHASVPQDIQLPTAAVILILFILLAAGTTGTWLVRHRSPFCARIYFWLVRLSEPQNDSVENHPKYLTQSLLRGGKLNDEYSLTASPVIQFGEGIDVSRSRYQGSGRIS